MNLPIWLLMIAVGACALAGWRMVTWQRWRRRLAQVPEPKLAGAERGVVSWQGRDIHFTSLGQGPELVLLHGIGASQYCWQLIAPHLAAHFRVTMIDLPGFGRSAWPDQLPMRLESLAQDLHLALRTVSGRPKFLCGSSLGGTLALEMAKQFPQAYPKVATLAPAAHPRLAALPFKYLAKWHWIFRGLLGEWAFRRALRRVHASPVPEAEVLQYMKPFFINPATLPAFFLATEILREPSLPGRFEGLKTPVLLIHGVQDRMVPLSVVEELHRILPHSRVANIDFCGHHPQEERPLDVTRLLVEFFNSPSEN